MVITTAMEKEKVSRILHEQQLSIHPEFVIELRNGDNACVQRKSIEKPR